MYRPSLIKQLLCNSIYILINLLTIHETLTSSVTFRQFCPKGITDKITSIATALFLAYLLSMIKIQQFSFYFL